MIGRDDWARLDTLLAQAIDRPEGEREAFLDEACAGDAETRWRLGRLLRIAQDTDPWLEPGGGLAGPVFEEVARELEATGPEDLAPGATLGRFVVKGLLGEGGMGRVYRALDPSLGREVAIKAVAHGFRDDAASLRRFEREARLLATLNHPNVGAIYGLELIEGAPYLVLELVEGETLAERLKRGALALGEALAVGVQVADALQEAHRQGIVHRDLKPANIKLGEAGRVKVLDFGLAKPVGPAAAGEPAEDAPSGDPTTSPGALVGTAPYMSPEQVRGLPVDPRSDVWAFGCVLYEMLTGRRAFQGRTTSDILAAVLRDEPDLEAVPPETPRGVRRLLRRCLRKDPRDRQQDAGDARLELTEAAMEEPPLRTPPSRFRTARLLPWLLALAAVVAVAAGYWASARPAAPAPRASRLTLDLPADLILADDYAAPFALSRDGSKLVVVARQAGAPQLFLRGLDALLPVRLPGTEGAWQPTFGPDGRAVAFVADRKLRIARIPSGEVLTVAEVGGNLRGLAWADDGTIVFVPGQNAPLFKTREEGGPLTALTRLDEAAGEVSHRWPQALPGGRILFTVAHEDHTYDEAHLEVVSLETGARTRVLEGGAYGRFVGGGGSGGHLVFARHGRLLAAPFDPRRLEVRGAPDVVVDGVRYDPQNGGTHVAASEDGTLLYSPGAPTSPERGLAFVSASGELTRLLDPPRALRDPSLSPDGRKVAAVLAQPRGADLWALDVATGTLSQLTFGLRPRRPVWMPDGKGITVGAPAGLGWRLLTVPARSAAAPAGTAGETLLETPARSYPNAWSADGHTLVFQERVPGTGWDVFAADRGPNGRLQDRRVMAATPADEANASLSPDGRFLAYESNELDGIFEIYVRALRGGASKVRVSNAGGRWPRFAPGGRLYYWQSFSPGGLRRVDYAVAREAFVAERLSEIWGALPGGEGTVARRLLVSPNDGPFDIDAAGGRFLMVERMTAAPDPPLRRPVVVLGFGAELQASRRP